MMAALFGCSSSIRKLSVNERLENAGIVGCSRVVGFSINPGEKYPLPNKGMIIDDHLNPDRIPKEGVTLSEQQISRLLDAAVDFNHTDWEAACFEPRHGFVFYQADVAIAAHCTICFQCRGFRSGGGRFSNAPDYESLERLVQELGLPMK